MLRLGKGALAAAQRGGREVALDDGVHRPEAVEQRLEELLRHRHDVALAVHRRLVDGQRRDDAEPAPVRLDQRVGDVARAEPARAAGAPRGGDLGRQAIDGHGPDATAPFASLHAPRPGLYDPATGRSAAPPGPPAHWSDDDGAHRPRGVRRGDPRPRPEPPGRRAGLVDPVRLREHDVLVRRRVGRDRPLPRQRPPVRGARRQPRPVARRRHQRRHQRPRVADPRRVLGSRRPPDAVPARVHRAVHRRHVLHRGRAAGHRRRPVHRRQLRVPGRADLLRRDAQDRQLAREPRPAVGHRHRHRLLRDRVHRPADLPARHACRRSLPADVDPVPRVRDPDLLVRARAPAPGRAAGHAGGASATRSASSSARSPTPGRSRACGGS